MQKCGMLYEGTMRQACLCNRGIFDKVNYAILAEGLFWQAGKWERTVESAYLSVKSTIYLVKLVFCE